MASCTCPASLHRQETRGNFPSERGSGTGITHPRHGRSTSAQSGGCWVDPSARTLPSAGHQLGQSPLLGHPSSELLVSVSLDGADGKQTKGCYGVTAPRTSPQGCVCPPSAPGAGAEPWACSGHPFCISCPKRVAASPSPAWDLRTPLSYLCSSRAPDVRSSLAWQIPRAGEAIPACPRQILLCSCLSRAT